MFPALKFIFAGFAIIIVLLLVFKLIYINVTPGEYVKYGCCSYGYLTGEQIEEEKMKINICPKVDCNIEGSSEYKHHSFFNHLDFNK